MYCGRCPYCSLEVRGEGYREAKRRLKEHLLVVHREKLEEQIERLIREGSGVPGGGLEGFAGFIASLVVGEC